MRKCMVLVMIALYSTAAMGVPLHYHYCEGELQHITIFVQKTCNSHDGEEHEAHENDIPHTCCMAKTGAHCTDAPDKSDDCCDNDSELVQIDEDVTFYIEPLLVPFDELAITPYHFTASSLTEELHGIAQSRAPPDTGGGLYLLHCSLVFYG